MRTFLTQGLTFAGAIEIGGLGEMSFRTAYDFVESTPDGAVGTEDVDRVNERTEVTIRTTDITKVNAILAATEAPSTYWAKESGLATWHKYTLPALVLSALRINFPRGEDANMELTGRIR